MKLRLAFLELCGLLAFGQTQFEQLPIPAPPQGPLPYVTIGFTDGSQLKYTEPPYELATASDGTLQIAQTQPLSNTPQLPLALPGLLFIQPGFAGAKITQAGGINMNGFTEHDLMYGSGIAAWGFSNQSGNISYICDGAPIPLDAMPFGYFGEQCVLTRITPTGVQPVCTGYSLDGTPGSLPYFWRGLSYDSAGNLYFIGMPADYGSSTIYRMLQSDIPATTGICQVETALKTNWQVFHAYPFENNQFLATIADSPENVGLAVFGIAVLNADGSSNVLVSTNAKSAPQILATGYPSLFWDAAKQRGLIAYNAGDAGHRRLFENGGMLPEVSDPNIANLGGDYVTAIGLNGDFALIGAGGSVKTDDHYTVAKNLIEINLADGSSGFINESTPLSGGFTASSGFRYGSAAATSDGTAYFVASNSTSTSIFGGKIPLASQPLAPVVSITAAQSSITAGGTVQLSWTAQMATSVAISPNIGPVAATGSQLISPTTTTTYTLTATGPGGTATVSVLVTVAVAPPTVSAVVNGGSFKLGPVAPGSLISIFGTGFNPGQGVVTKVDFALNGTAVLVDGGPIRIIGANTTQINAVLPNNTAVGAHGLVVKVNGVASLPAAFTVAPQAVALLQAPLTDPDGKTVVIPAITTADFHVIGPSSIPGLAVPSAGDTLIGWSTGCGATDPPMNELDLGAAPPWTCAVPPPITVDGVPVQILFAGRSPGFGTFGLDQVNFVLPPGLLPGGHQLAYGPMTYMLQTN